MARTIQDTDFLLLREVFDQSPLAIQVLSPDGRIRHVNRAWERLWGTTLDRVPDYSMLEDPQLDAAGVAHYVRRAFAGAICEAPEILYDPDGTLPGRSDPAEPRWVRSLFYPVRDDAGKVAWVVLVQEDTTRRHELEEEAREAAARFCAIAELTSDYAYSFRVEPGGETTLEWVSVSTTAVLGMSREEILEIGWRGLIPPEDHAAVREHIRRVFHGENDSVDHRMVGRDGRIRWVTSTSHVVRDPSSGRAVRVYGVSRDVTERMRAEGERDRFFALSLDMLAVAGVDGYFRRVNPAMERTLGYSADELLSRPFFDFIHPDDRAATRGEVEKLERGEHSVAFENRYRCADGSYRWLAWNSSPSVADGLLYCAARDITDPKRSAERLERALAGERAARAEAEAARQKLHEANELEPKARAAAEAANRTKDEFLAVLGHELRNPIGAIRTATRVLERLGLPEGESDERKNLLGLLTRQTHMLGRLVDDLLEVSRFGSGKIVLRRVPVELGEICGAALTSFEAAGNLSRHVVSTDLRPARVEGDPERLEQIVGNLLENAVKYTPEGGRISVRVAEENGQAVLRMRDEGRGIAPEMLSRIFDFFVQAEPSLPLARGPGDRPDPGRAPGHAPRRDGRGRERRTRPRQRVHRPRTARRGDAGGADGGRRGALQPGTPPASPRRGLRGRARGALPASRAHGTRGRGRRRRPAGARARARGRFRRGDRRHRASGARRLPGRGTDPLRRARLESVPRRAHGVRSAGGTASGAGGGGRRPPREARRPRAADRAAGRGSPPAVLLSYQVRESSQSSFRLPRRKPGQKPESSLCVHDWTPAFAGVTELWVAGVSPR